MQYASFTKRFLAALFDFALINLVVMVMGDFILMAFGYGIDNDRLDVLMQAAQAGQPIDILYLQQVVIAGLILSVLAVMVVVLVDAVLPASKLMASPGKALFQMVMVDEKGQRLSFSRSFGRHAAKCVSMLSVVGFLMPFWNDKRQALHDKMAGTYVAKKNSLEVR